MSEQGKDRYAFLPDRVRLGIGLLAVIIAWWLFVLPRDLWRALVHVATGSWHDVVLLWRGILANERIETDRMGLENE